MHKIFLTWFVLLYTASGCPTGWYGFGNSCYLFRVRSLNVRGLNWDNARSYCLSYNGDLVSVSNRSEMDFIKTKTSKAGREYFWIGLNDRRKENVFVWSDGTPYNKSIYSNWYPNEPNDIGGEDCVELFPAQWNDNSCMKEKSYICERPKGLPMPTFSPGIPPPTFAPIACPFGWVYYGSSCYLFSDVRKKWVDAKTTCRQLGGTLLKIDDANEQHFISWKLAKFWKTNWIGLTDSSVEGRYRWESDNSPVNYTNWARGEPNDYGGVEDCISVYGGGSTGLWNDDYCDSEHYYICEKVNGRNICPINWRNFGDFCYKFNVHGALHKTWIESEKVCKTFSNSSELISIGSEAEQRFLLAQLKGMRIVRPVWLGLNDVKIEGRYTWSDGSIVKYRNWEVNQPPIGIIGRLSDCTVIDPRTVNGTWSSTLCYGLRGYVCKRKLGAGQCNSPFGMEDGSIGDNDIIASSSFNDSSRASQARLHLTSDNSTAGAWCAAQNKVGEYIQIDLGVVRQIQHLALQGRPESSDFVKTLYLRYGNNGLDFNNYGENATVKYKTLTGNSNSRTISNIVLPESINARFIRIYPVTWSSRICLRTEVYGCAAQGSSNKCGIGWEVGPDNTCYQINADHGKIWADARATCLSRKGDLVSITSSRERNWLNNRLRAVSSWSNYFWIGLNDRDMSSLFYWSDGSPYSLRAWYPGAPSDYSSKNLKACVKMYTSSVGYWMDASCGEYRPYVCKRRMAPPDGKKFPVTGNWISGTNYYWPLNELVDNDTKALGTIPGTVYGNVNKTSGFPLGRDTLHFSSFGAYLDVGPFPAECIIDPSQCIYGLTVSFVVQFEDSAQNWTRDTLVVDTIGGKIMRKGNPGFAVYVANNRLYVTVVTRKNNWTVSESLITGDMVWQHVLFSWHMEKGLVLHLNGTQSVPLRHGTSSVSSGSRSVSLTVGSKTTQPSLGGFRIRSLAVWERALSVEEVRMIYLAELGSCQTGWKAFGQNCYQVSSNKKSWIQARLACANQRADLVSIHSPVEQAHIALQVGPYGLNAEAWIGLNDRTMEGVFLWSDRSAVDYINWDKMNSHYSWRFKDCASVKKDNEGRWRDQSCFNSFSYICKKPKEYIPPNKDSGVTAQIVSSFCPSGWQNTSDGSRCFRVIFDRKKWQDARSACQYLGADLASFHSSTDNIFVTTLLVNSWDIADVGGMWIGLTDADQKGIYRWTDGTDVDYSSWLHGQPDERTLHGSCVSATLQRGKLSSLFWQDLNCTLELPYACSMQSKKNMSSTPTPTTVPLKPCPSGWMSNGSFCYKMMPHSKTWTDARASCGSFGSNVDLVSIHSLAENAFVANAVLKNSAFAAWIGLSDRGVLYGYAWSDKSPVKFTRWNPQQPDSHFGQQPCVEMYSTGEWADTGCYSVKKFICKMSRTANSATFSPTFTTSTQGPITCPPGWILWNSMCYYFSNDSLSSKMSWQDAVQACRRIRGGDLVSIHSASENTFIKSKISRRSSLNFWIGLNDLGLESSFKWSDGSPVQYTNYAFREPNDFFKQEDCVEMHRFSGTWNDNHCSRRSPYICKIKGSVHPTIFPTTPTRPKLKWCKKGWLYYESKCYLLVSDSKQTWGNARSVCRQGLNGRMKGDLVTVDNQYEQAFLITALIGRQSVFWIGLNDFHIDGTFYWTDNSPVKFTNWGAGQPSRGRTFPSCVSMTPFGRWINRQCWQRRGYICEAGALPDYTNSTVAPAQNQTSECPLHYNLVGDDCYFVSSIKLTWKEAREVCKRESNGDLISVHSRVEQAYVLMNLKNFNGGIWLGLFRGAFSAEFAWSDHSITVYTAWAPKQPNAPNAQKTCVVVNSSNSNTGLWDDIDCAARNGFICKIRKGEPHISPSVVGSCPSGWIKFDQHCYLFRDTYNDRRTWTSARYMCLRQGANLLSITSKQEQDFISHHFTDNLHGQVWLGLNDRNIEAGYTWSDGSPVTFLNWHPGEPNDANNVENCAEMYPVDTRWNDIMCTDLNGYICKQPLECSRALGMIDGSLRSKVNASSWISYKYHPDMAFLNSSSAWCAKTSHQNQYIQVEFLNKTRLSKIATQGSIFNGAASYINTFKVQTSLDGINFATYQKNGKDSVFIANQDSDSIVTSAIKPPIDIPRFIRLVPIIWTGAICLRMELYGCPYVCETPLGMKSGAVKDADISTSSSNSSQGATNARPFSYVGWCAQVSDTQPWFQISFIPYKNKITRLTTWGGGLASGYVKVYNLQFADGANASIWSNYTEGGKIRNFRGNQDAVHPLTHLLAEPIITQNLRVKPLSWSPAGVCLRLEIYGCKTEIASPSPSTTSVTKALPSESSRSPATVTATTLPLPLSTSPSPPAEVSFSGSLRLLKIEWTDRYNNPKAIEFQTLARRVEESMIQLYSGKDEASLAFLRVEVTGFKRGSVIVLFNLAFIGDITQDDLGINATNNLASAVTTGRLGELVVDPRSLSIFNTAHPPKTTPINPSAAGQMKDKSSEGMSSGAKAGISVVVLMVICLCGGAVAWYFYRRKKGKPLFENDGFHNPIYFSSKEEKVLTGVTKQAEDVQ
ncbi:uncharacterized protein LOC114946811 isoform X1 [Acropora millepora]|uniref:uncharacterized protein LOC114946811 isoform X1 n=1 Tax=Acropora millepora TaxID=45264 RepID=UPI001CF5CFD6|nr:uncharacterized protein LOC114946811 isoform X1 [Acropora millepora]